MEPSTSLLRMLSCPVSGGELIYDQENNQLISKKAGLAYPIVDGIPLLLKSRSKKNRSPGIISYTQ